ncbi:hypothetical protein FVAG_03094 [Fusobacterium varium ATCC 27725]|nr:hypothetical protein FVAG_03094 [Fusobacterium varium ATCC 27725]
MKSSQETYLILVLAFIGEIRVMNYYTIMIYLLKIIFIPIENNQFFKTKILKFRGISILKF